MKKLALFCSTLITLFSILHASEDKDPWRAEEYYQNSTSQKDAAKELMKFVQLKDNDKILDVGCGDGKITSEIATKTPNGFVIGIDLSPAMIQFAQTNFPTQNHPNLTFLIKRAEELDYTNEFDVIFSFTALQWVQDHNLFLEGASRGLKSSGTLAVTMPMGLPFTLEQAVNEVMALPEWTSYFQNFSTGWNFIEAADYDKLLTKNHFSPSRLAVVPQKDIFPSRVVFQKFISQWFPYLRPLPENLKQTFLNLVVDRFLELENPFPNGEVHFKVRRLEVVATKNEV